MKTELNEQSNITRYKLLVLEKPDRDVSTTGDRLEVEFSFKERSFC